VAAYVAARDRGSATAQLWDLDAATRVIGPTPPGLR